MKVLKVITILGLVLATLAVLPLAAVAVTQPEKMDVLIEVLAKGLEGLGVTLEYMLHAFAEYLNWLLELFAEATS